MSADVETLAFAVSEGSTENFFLRRGPVAAHLVATSGRQARVLVALPAGNTGAALWFEERPERVAITVEGAAPGSGGGPLAAVEEGAMRGVSATLSLGAPELCVRAAGLGSVRTIRDLARCREARGEPGCAVDPGPPFTLSRAAPGGGRHVALRLVPHGGAAVRVAADGRIVLTAAAGEPLRVTLTALSDDPPLTPIPSGELLTGAAAADERARSTLAFLSYEEKLLAGSWRFLTYFGRDTLLSLRLLLPVLGPRAVEAGLGAVLDRLGPGGEVAHEETVGPWGTGEPLDHSMVDDDFLLAPLAAAYLLDGAGRAGAAAFLSRRAASGEPYAALLAHNLALVLALATPFAGSGDGRALVALREDRAAGDWRDSIEGLGGGRVPFAVNAALVPAALEAAGRLFASGILGAHPGSAERAAVLAGAFRGVGDRFRVSVPLAEARRRVAAQADHMGLDPAPALASIQGDIVFPALALDAAGAPVPVMHSDDGFVLLFTDPPPGYLEEAAQRVVRPFPAGLWTPAGLVVANPAFCPDRAVRELFTPAHYHGTVVWSFQHALLAAGLRRQLARADLPPRTRAALGLAADVLGEIGRASAAWSASELWSVAAQDGRLGRIPFGARREHHDESNAAQLWSTVGLAAGA